MKLNCIITILLAFATHHIAVAQLEIRDINGQPWHLDHSGLKQDGTPLLSVNWGTGNVKCINNTGLDSVQMNIDLENNRVLYVQDGKTYTLAQPVLECQYTFTEDEKTKTVTYRSSYPETSGHNTNTLYEVLAEGPRYQLLQFSSKKTMERREYNGPLTVYYQLNSDLFIYDSVAKDMHKIKAKRSSIVEALPGKEEAIDKICKENNLELKTGSQVALLISKLN